VRVLSGRAIQQLCKPTKNVISTVQLTLIPYGSIEVWFAISLKF